MNDLYRVSLQTAREYHKKQIRKVRGNPYTDHLSAVAEQILYMGGDIETVCAGLLHDILEDTEMTEHKLRLEMSLFASEEAINKIMNIVKAMTQNKTLGPNERLAAQLEKVFIIGRDAMLVLLADYLDNVSNLVRDQKEFGYKLWEKFNVKPEMKFKAIEKVIKFLDRYLKTNRSEVEALARLYLILKTEYRNIKK